MKRADKKYLWSLIGEWSLCNSAGARYAIKQDLESFINSRIDAAYDRGLALGISSRIPPRTKRAKP